MIDENDIERLKEIFMTRRECDSTMGEVDKKLANDSTELALIKQELNTIKWVAKATLTSSIGLLVTYIFTAIIGG
jgi:hypothetical protein